MMFFCDSSNTQIQLLSHHYIKLSVYILTDFSVDNGSGSCWWVFGELFSAFNNYHPWFSCALTNWYWSCYIWSYCLCFFMFVCAQSITIVRKSVIRMKTCHINVLIIWHCERAELHKCTNWLIPSPVCFFLSIVLEDNKR